MTVKVDGKKINNDQIVRADSPLFSATLPEENVFGAFGVEVPAGEYDAVSDGLWASLPSLSNGDHTIHFEMSAPNAGFSQDNTYHLTVE